MLSFRSFRANFRRFWYWANLEAATPAQLDKAIADYGASGTTKDRSVRFFLKAAEYAQIKLASRLTARKPRTPSSSNGDSEPAQGRTRSRKNEPVPPTITPAGNIKTVTLPNVGGTLTISGTFNPFELVGEERELVFGITDLITTFEKKHQGK